MKSSFIINFTASKSSSVNTFHYSTMTSAENLQVLNNFIITLCKSFLEKLNYERVYVKIWKWELEEAAFMFQGVVYDNDTKTIYI